MLYMVRILCFVFQQLQQKGVRSALKQTCDTCIREVIYAHTQKIRKIAHALLFKESLWAKTRPVGRKTAKLKPGC